MKIEGDSTASGGAAGTVRWEKLQRTLSSFQNYNFRIYWFGQLISQAGTWMQTVGQAWLVLELTQSPVALGTVIALQTLPVLCIVLFAGVIVDRLPKHRVMLATQSVALVQSLILAILTATGHIQLWQIYILAATLGFVNAFDNPTRQSFVMELVGRENLVNAVGLNSAQFNSARLIGPAIGGVLIARWGVSVCFFINAISYLAALTALLKLRPAEFHLTAETRHRGRMLSELSEGIRFIKNTPRLLVVIILLSGLGCFGYNWNTVTPLLATDLLHSGATGFGLMVSALGIGSLGGAVMLAVRGRSSVHILFGAAIIFGVGYLAVGFVPWFGLSFVLFAILGFVGLTFSTSANTTLQLGSPDHLRGRVMGIFTLLMLGSTPIGSLVTGFLTASIGIQWAVATEASICLLAVALALTYQVRVVNHGQPVGTAASRRLAVEGAPAGTAAGSTSGIR